MGEFKDMINQCALRDLGFKGPQYTWCNGREGVQCISERLDRFLANTH